MNGVLNLYKPKGISSSAAVSKARRILGVKSAGHMGTLDPAGEGVLLVGVGKAARLFDYFLKKDKLYQAEFTFGYQTDTLDGEGKIIKSCDIIPDMTALSLNLKKLLGKQMQMPPAYSAKNVNGVRAYSLARQGKEFDLSPSPIEIYDAQIISYSSPVCNVLVHCSSGTYIRSVCRDLAELCGSFATMTAIKRLASGKFKVEDSVDFKMLEEQGEGALIKTENALTDLKKIELDKKFKTKLNNGVKIGIYDAEIEITDEDFALFCGGELYGIAHIKDDKIAIKAYLRD